MTDPKNRFEQEPQLIVENSEPAETAEKAETAENAEAAEAAEQKAIPEEDVATAFEKGKKQRAEKQPAYTKPPKQDGPKPRYVGRFTLGAALIFTGGIITASMFVKDFDLLTVAKFTPLILVVLGIEILASTFRRSDRPVKVGFGTVFLCLVLIGGSMCVSVLPYVWEEYGPGYTKRVNAATEQAERKIYEQYPVENLERLSIGSSWMGEDGIHLRVDAVLDGEFETAQQFAEKALPLVQMLAGMQEVDTVYIQSGDAWGNWSLSLDPVYPWQDVAAEALAGKVEHSYIVMTQDGSWEMDAEKYQKMLDENKFTDAETLETIRNAAYAEGYQKAMTDAGVEAGEVPSIDHKSEFYQKMVDNNLYATPEAVEYERKAAYEEGYSRGETDAFRQQDAAENSDDAAYDQGHAAGYEEGFADGKAEGFEEAQQEFESQQAA